MILLLAIPFNIVLDRLNVDVELRQKLDDLWYSHRLDMVELDSRIKKTRLELEKLITDKTWKEGEIKKKVSELIDLETQRLKKNILFHLEVIKSVPPEKRKMALRMLLPSREGPVRRMENRRHLHE